MGKSTVAANLAVALAQAGFSVGLMDADVYGPNIPRMFGVYRPAVTSTSSSTPITSTKTQSGMANRPLSG